MDALKEKEGKIEIVTNNYQNKMMDAITKKTEIEVKYGAIGEEKMRF